MRRRVDGRAALVTAACIGLILAPLGVEAATDNVVIKDSGSNQKANVSGGDLHVGDGNGPLTVNGTLRVTNGPGHLQVVPGATNRFITGRGTLEASPVNVTQALAGDQQLRITSFTLANTSDSVPADVILRHVEPTNSDDCIGPGVDKTPLARVMVGPSETLHLTYPHPLVVNEEPSQQEFCVIARHGGSVTPDPAGAVSISLDGYMEVF